MWSVFLICFYIFKCGPSFTLISDAYYIFIGNHRLIFNVHVFSGFFWNIFLWIAGLSHLSYVHGSEESLGIRSLSLAFNHNYV